MIVRDDWTGGNESTVGWVYQYFNAEEKAAAFDKVFKRKKKFEKADIPAATQIFTPRWIVRFLVENSLGRLWLAMHPDSALRDTLTYLVPLVSDPPRSTLKPAKEIRVLDPATGTMHFGLVAFDLLIEMYREELARAGTPGWPALPSVPEEADIPASILANNLFGIDIDLRAVQLAALALYLKAKAKNKLAILNESNLACADVTIFRGKHLSAIANEMPMPKGFTGELLAKFRDSLEEASLMGSLVRLERHVERFQSDSLRSAIDQYVKKKHAEGVDESYFANESAKGLRLLNVLERRYDIVFTNPPYMRSRNMSPAMSTFITRDYKKSSRDLYAAFIERCAELLADDGRLAMITQQSFMFIGSYKRLRAILLDAVSCETVLHLGPRAFPEVQGENVNTVAFVVRRDQYVEGRNRSVGVYFRLIKEPDGEAKRQAFESALAKRHAGVRDSRLYEYPQVQFVDIPDRPLVYWISPSLRRLFTSLPALSDVAPAVFGTKTYDNVRFVRFWWEVGRSSITTNLRHWVDLSSRNDVRYVPLMKGGSGRWTGNEIHTLQLLESGRVLESFLESKSDGVRGKDFVFSRGVSFSLLSTKTFRARVMPDGFVFDVSVPSFPTENPHTLLAILNSQLSLYLLRVLNPTINFPTGDVCRLPYKVGDSLAIDELVRMAIGLTSEEHLENETALDFVAPAIWPSGAEVADGRRLRLKKIEAELDQAVYHRYEISASDQELIAAELSAETLESDDESEVLEPAEDAVEPSEEISLQSLAASWISFAFGVAIGRFTHRPSNDGWHGRFGPRVTSLLERMGSETGLMLLKRGHPGDLAQRILDILSTIHSDAESSEIVKTAAGTNGDLRDILANYLLGPFFKAHVTQYRKRPIYWLLQSSSGAFSAYLFHERATDQTLAMLQGNSYLGGEIFKARERQKEAKTKELSSQGRERARWQRESQEAADDLIDLEEFQKAVDQTNNESIVDADGHPATARWVPEFDDGILLNAAPLYRLTPTWKRADAKLDLSKVWTTLKDGAYPWAKTAMRYWPRETITASKQNRSFRIAHGLE